MLLCFAFSLALAKRFVLCRIELLISITNQFFYLGLPIQVGEHNRSDILLKG
jgi:hypothetical protein